MEMDSQPGNPGSQGGKRKDPLDKKLLGKKTGSLSSL